MPDKKILIIEDEYNIARFLQLELEHEGYEVGISHDGREGLDKACSDYFDLLILDVMLPSLNGVEVLRRLRQKSDMPVVMLTAKDEMNDKILGLDIGADDYMTKPFAIEELLARIRVIFKRMDNYKASKPQNDSILRIKGVNLDIDRYTVTYKEKNIDLTKREFELLKYMMQNKNLVITREMILAKVWGYEYMGDTNVVDVYIRYLRSKIDDQFGIKLIHTIRGVGYQIKDE
ncbi:MAG: response regulator transcription factor [Acetoanaerobium sp.]|uniref:Stage 0 sporulation protein A homolog n=1 Tax=Acetoanaerobium sticklandii (strain ATCC 12662 / DSM 519 / JCM 1433 / CCUG 9281 / NCIMB 10654 / HF) TaxID=499177 RepID=E3PUE1_ACESD|nr:MULTISPECIES: response regulator transcription factor [Acetoanaerobium]MBP9500339.1 response regulator transcription factor [Acetoanaerobium sp.]MBP9562788.1 response regulator transcription factor [Acetoanaerobium sp.]CBH22379.1 DNA-binding response regulator in two-component system with YedV [Acetoanaerobium sticklandii]